MLFQLYYPELSVIVSKFLVGFLRMLLFHFIKLLPTEWEITLDAMPSYKESCLIFVSHSIS